MCGLVGYFTPRTSQPRLMNPDAARDIMAHRGPDGRGAYVSPDGCFQAGFCRLSIIDLETSQQPIVENGGEKVLLGNGEIYNYRELADWMGCSKLAKHGDTRVLIEFLSAYGLKRTMVWDPNELDVNIGEFHLRAR